MGVNPKVIEKWEKKVIQCKKDEAVDEDTIDTSDENEQEPVIKPEWHQDEARSALRRRHIKAKIEREKESHVSNQCKKDKILMTKFSTMKQQKEMEYGITKNPIDAIVIKVMAYILVLFFATLLLLWWRYLLS